MAQLIAIAASQAGPAHSFMVAEALRAAAESLGHRIAVSVHSSLGTQGGFSDGELDHLHGQPRADRHALPDRRLLRPHLC
ncbi:hypothetical protein C8236_17055, partial [Paracidovorax avenae]